MCKKLTGEEINEEISLRKKLLIDGRWLINKGRALNDEERKRIGLQIKILGGVLFNYK
jgi:hypothetical protein